MPASASYLRRGMYAILDRVWEIVACHASCHDLEEITPCPPKDTPRQDLIGPISMKPVVKLLQAQDIPAQARAKLSGPDFVLDSPTVHDIEHGERCPAGCQILHIEELSAGASAGYTEYRVQWSWKPGRSFWGASTRMPEYVPEVLRRALVMQNLCEWAVMVLLPSVEKMARLIDIDAKVCWMSVVPRRRIQLTVYECSIATTHAVLFNQSPLAGNLVLDPTGEQYGIPREHLFLSWRDYKKRYIISPGKWKGQAVWSTRTEAQHSFLGEFTDYVFWKDVKDALDSQVSSWLMALGDDLRSIMDDEGMWRRAESELEADIKGAITQLHE